MSHVHCCCADVEASPEHSDEGEPDTGTELYAYIFLKLSIMKTLLYVNAVKFLSEYVGGSPKVLRSRKRGDVDSSVEFIGFGGLSVVHFLPCEIMWKKLGVLPMTETF